MESKKLKLIFKKLIIKLIFKFFQNTDKLTFRIFKNVYNVPDLKKNSLYIYINNGKNTPIFTHFFDTCQLYYVYVL